jgi:hypothetical protein
MKIPTTKHGLAADVRGAHVTMRYRGRTLLGTVVDADRDPATNSIRLMIRHFNGEPWPLRPAASAVELLERTYD